MAQSHMKDIGAKGLVSHTGSHGKTFKKRSESVIPFYSAVAENIGLGYSSALANTIGLLIDQGVKNLGHRETILQTKYDCVGVALGGHKKIHLWLCYGFRKNTRK